MEREEGKDFLALLFIIVGGVILYKAWQKAKPKPRVVITIGPFSFITREKEKGRIKAIVERLQKETKAVFTERGLEIIFPPLPLDIKIGIIEVTPPPKVYSYRDLQVILTDRQKRAIIRELSKQIKQIKVEKLDEERQKIIIPEINIPIY